MNSKHIATYFALVGLVIVLGVILMPMQAHAAPSALPPRPTPVTPTPIMPTPTTSSVVSGGSGASIQLSVSAATDGWSLWTEVQWQDALGGWHPVEGWRGQLDSVSNGVGLKTWWVAPGDFGKGPFRWQVYQTAGGQWLTSSTPFNLPSANRTLVAVDVELTP